MDSLCDYATFTILPQMQSDKHACSIMLDIRVMCAEER
jgi:hypothetical protein